MRRLLSAAFVTACVALSQPVFATPITYILTGTLSGTLTDANAAVTPITNQSFVWTLEADTENALHIVQPPPPFPIAVTVVPAAADVIEIGTTMLTPTIPLPSLD